MQAALVRVDGVHRVEFDLDTDSIYVGYDARLGEPKDVAKRFVTAIEGAGYRPAWFKAEATR